MTPAAPAAADAAPAPPPPGKETVIAAVPEAATQTASADPVIVALMAAAANTARTSGLEPAKAVTQSTGTVSDISTVALGTADAATTAMGAATAATTKSATVGSTAAPSAPAANPAQPSAGAQAPNQAQALNQAQASEPSQPSGHTPAQTSVKASNPAKQTDQGASAPQATATPPAASALPGGAAIAGTAVAAPAGNAQPSVPVSSAPSLRTSSLTERIQVVNQVAQQIQALHGANAPAARTVTMQLHPEQWGPVTITVTAHADTQGQAAVSAVVLTGHADAQALLSRHGQDLKDALSSAGLRLDKLDVRTATVVAASSSHGADGHQQGQRESQGSWSAQGGASSQMNSQGGQGFAFAFDQGRSQRQAPADAPAYPSLQEHIAPLSAIARAGGVDLHA